MKTSFHILIITDKWIIIQFFPNWRSSWVWLSLPLCFCYICIMYSQTRFFSLSQNKNICNFREKKYGKCSECLFLSSNKSTVYMLVPEHWFGYEICSMNKINVFFFVSDALTQCLFENVDFCSKIDHLDNLKPNTMVVCNTVVVCNTICNNVIKWI